MKSQIANRKSQMTLRITKIYEYTNSYFRNKFVFRSRVKGFTLIESTIALGLLSVLLVAFSSLYFSFGKLRGIPENYLLYLESIQTSMDYMTREIRGARGFNITSNSLSFTDPRGGNSTTTYRWQVDSPEPACSGVATSTFCVTRTNASTTNTFALFPGAVQIEDFRISSIKTCPDGSENCQPKFDIYMKAKIQISGTSVFEREFKVGVTPRFLQQ